MCASLFTLFKAVLAAFVLEKRRKVSRGEIWGLHCRVEIFNAPTVSRTRLWGCGVSSGKIHNSRQSLMPWIRCVSLSNYSPSKVYLSYSRTAACQIYNQISLFLPFHVFFFRHTQSLADGATSNTCIRPGDEKYLLHSIRAAKEVICLHQIAAVQLRALFVRAILIITGDKR